MDIIQVSDLRRAFGDFVAVKDVNFEVAEGEIFGFLGPNGAGKSTTINVLCTLLKPTSGRASVNGFDVATNQGDVRRSIGLIFQDPTLDERLTGWQNLQFHAMLYDVPTETFDARAKELLDMVELTDKVREDVKAFSGGMKRRLEIARGLLHHPKVLFLDEPTIGLDPQTRRHIWEYLRQGARLGGAYALPHHALPGRGRGLRPHRHHRPRRDRRARHAFEAQGHGRRRRGHALHERRRARHRSARDARRRSRRRPPTGLRVEIDHGDRFIPTVMRAMDEADPPVSISSVNLRGRPSKTSS